MIRTFISAVALAALSPAVASAATTFVPSPTSTNFQFGYQNNASSGSVVFDASELKTSGCSIGGTSCFEAGSFLGAYFAPADGNYQGADLLASEVTLHPGPQEQLIGLQFVAPTAGTYRFTGAVRAADAPSGDGVTFFTATGSGSLGVRPATEPFSFSQTLAAGGTSRFLIGNNGNYSFDTTGLSLSVAAVPEPATWAMMIGGFGMVGGAMRSARRRQKVSVTYA
jgi:hypothetical protein